MSEAEVPDFESQKESRKKVIQNQQMAAPHNDTKATKTTWRKWLQGAWIVQFVPFLLFVAVLAVLYIGNGHYADNNIRNTGKAYRDLKQLQYQYKTLQAELIYRSKESELSRAVVPLGLQQSVDPPVMLRADSIPDKKGTTTE
jgi:uncharacterized protein HemX